MASFIMASTAFGVCSQSGIVKTALAFAAATRKSSTVFVSAAGRLGLVTAKTNGQKRNEDFIVVESWLTPVCACRRKGKFSRTVLSAITRRSPPPLLKRAHGRDSQVAFNRGAKLRNMRHDDSEIFPRLYPNLCRHRSNRTCRDLYRTRCQHFAGAAETTSVSGNRYGSLRSYRIYFSRGDYFLRAGDHGCGLSSRGRSYSAWPGRTRVAKSRGGQP